MTHISYEVRAFNDTLGWYIASIHYPEYRYEVCGWWRKKVKITNTEVAEREALIDAIYAAKIRRLRGPKVRVIRDCAGRRTTVWVNGQHVNANKET